MMPIPSSKSSCAHISGRNLAGGLLLGRYYCGHVGLLGTWGPYCSSGVHVQGGRLRCGCALAGVALQPSFDESKRDLDAHIIH